MKRKNLLTATVITFALALTVWTIGATVNLSTIGFNASSGDVVSASDFNNAFATVDNNFADVEAAINTNRSGIMNAFEDASTTLTATTQEINSVTIDVPAEGVVVVQATGLFVIDHVQGGGDDFARAYLSTLSADDDFRNFAAYTVNSGQPTDSIYDSTWAIQLVAEVPSAGSYTYYLNGDIANESQPGANEILRPHLVATFHPATYGTVTATSNDVSPVAERSGPNGN